MKATEAATQLGVVGRVASRFYSIDKNVPFPKKGQPLPVFPFGAMAVGDSFLLDCDKSERDKYRSRITYHLGRYCKTHKERFTIRLMDDGVRCWRVS